MTGRQCERLGATSRKDAGATATIVKRGLSAGRLLPEVLGGNVSLSPVACFGLDSEIAHIARFLVDVDAAFIIAPTITANGG